MAERINLVQGDNLPYITLTLTDPATSEAINLSDAEISVSVRLREKGGGEVLATIPCEKVASGTTGKVRFNFPDGTLDVEAGFYQGEVEVTFGDNKQTVYEVLEFRVREQFG